MIYGDYFKNESIPLPLSKEELFHYFKAFHEGNMEARNTIIEHNLRLVSDRVSKRFSNFPYEEQDLMSYGMSGLIQAVDTYDPSLKYSFSTYASTCIDHAILVYLRKFQRMISTDSLDQEIIHKSDGSSLIRLDTVSDPTCNFVLDYEKRETILEIHALIETFSLRDRMILNLSFGLSGHPKCTQEDIASRLNMTRTNVTMRLARLIYLIRKKLLEHDNVPVKKK